MQNIFLENFNKDINNIREYIKHINLVDKIEEENKNTIEEGSIKNFVEHFRNFRTEKRRFEHRAVIISLYGILENHINIWVQEHINNIPFILKDDSLLSTKILESNFNLSIELVSTLFKQRNNPKYENISKEDIVKKLNSDEFELNSEAFISSSGNLTHQKIIELLAPLEIDTKKINQHSIVKNNKSNIDTLISFRNEISHGTKIDNIITEFSEYIDSLEVYGQAIFSIIEDKEKEYHIKYEMKYSFEQIKVIYKVIDNSILLFELVNNNISIGDFIIIKTKDNNLHKKQIVSIQIEGSEKNIFTTTDKVNIGIGIETDELNIKYNQTFYIKKKEN